MIEVLELAGSALFQDLGRARLASGVPICGAFDRAAHSAGALLVGGDPGQASLELVGRAVLRPGTRITAAVTGRGRAWIDGRAVPLATSLEVAPGRSLELVAEGRLYLAVAGGLRPAPVLGSRSTSVLDGLGPPPVRGGDRLPISSNPESDTVGDVLRMAPESSAVRVVAGPHLTLRPGVVEVVDTSRIGVRLRAATCGGPTSPADPGLLSCGVLPGTIQVLPSGDWMLLGPDAGTMGGYPIIGVVVTGDLGRWAHVQPGELVELVPVRDAPAPVDPVILRVGRLG
ncbi:MAG: hypothetical protein WCF36_06730 [Candidatus Nanopelagicales bacterium]